MLPLAVPLTCLGTFGDFLASVMLERLSARKAVVPCSLHNVVSAKDLVHVAGGWEAVCFQFIVILFLFLWSRGGCAVIEQE